MCFYCLLQLYVLCWAQLLSHAQLFATPWTVAHQALLSMEFSRQEHWSGLTFLSPGDLPNPGGIEPTSPAFQVDSLPLNHVGTTYNYIVVYLVKYPFLFSCGFKLLSGFTFFQHEQFPIVVFVEHV